MTIQEQIDKLLKEIQESIKLLEIPRVLIPKNNKDKTEVIVEIPEDATKFQKAAIETINYLRNIQRCPKCNSDEGGIQTLNDNGEWKCVIHKN